MASGKGKSTLSTQKRTGSMPPKKTLSGTNRAMVGSTVQGVSRNYQLSEGPPELGVSNSTQHASQSQVGVLQTSRIVLLLCSLYHQHQHQNKHRNQHQHQHHCKSHSNV